MNVSPAPNPVLQELQLQRSQVVQQVEAHETQLTQVRRQALIINQFAASSGGGRLGPMHNHHSPMCPTKPNPSSSFYDLDMSLSMINQRSGPALPHMNRGISPSNFAHQQQQQQNNNNINRGGMMMNLDLNMRMSEMKLGQQHQQQMGECYYE